MTIACMQRLVFAVSAVLVSGCVSWQEVGNEPYVDDKLGFSLKPPTGWYQPPSKGPGGAVYFTRDGLLLQEIHVGRVAHDDAFANIEKSSSASMSPELLAENYIANLTAIEVFENMTVNSNEPAIVGGRDGFRVDLEFRTPNGLRYREIHYCAAGDAGLYSLVYSASVLHYFDRHIEDFERTYASLDIR